jgi:acetyl-CoA carboxylase biotin carboxyl carrier protein
MNLKEIKDLIELVNDKGFAEFEIERQGFRLRISRFKESPPTQVQPPPHPVVVSAAIPGAPEVLSAGAQRQSVEAEAPPAESKTSVKKKPDDAKAAEPESELRMIKSPIVGTFYRASSPNSEPFVRTGDHVEPDTVVCIIEAMKLMNEIQAELSGEIVKIYIENGQPVEYGQALFGVRAG